MAEPTELKIEPQDAPAVGPSEPVRARPSIKELVRANPRLVASGAMMLLGVLFVMLGWYGAANTNILTEQIPYLISGGLLGLGLIVVAGFLASSSMVERRTDELRQDLMRAMDLIPSAGAAPTNGSARAATPAGEVFVLAGGHSYHLAGCPIIEGKENVSSSTARKAIASGFEMCKLCGPE